MADRLVAYLRHYFADRPQDHNGHLPIVPVVFDDQLAESNFPGVSRKAMERANISVPMCVSNQELLEEIGPLGKARRSPQALEGSYAFK